MTAAATTHSLPTAIASYRHVHADKLCGYTVQPGDALMSYPLEPLIASFLCLLVASPAHAVERFTDPFGGPGGQQFILRCPDGKQVTGVTALVGAYVNNIAPVCDGLQLKGVGGSGQRSDAICPAGSVVGFIRMRSLRSPNRLLKELVVQCLSKTAREATASVWLRTKGAYTEGWDWFRGGTGNVDTSYPARTQDCGNQRMVGLQGRSGAAVDALGLICD